MAFAATPSTAGRRAVADVATTPFWLDSPNRPSPTDPLTGATTTNLAVIGGGYSGLWTALLAKEADPSRDVVVLEGGSVGWAASGRNGGFCSASLTHGFRNGLERFPDELAAITALGHANLDGIEATLLRYGIDADFERTGDLTVAVDDHHVEALAEVPKLAASYGESYEFLDRDEVTALVNSPTYLAGLLDRDGMAMVNPAKLAWGLRDACLALGVRIYEGTVVTSIETSTSGVELRTRDGGLVSAARVALMTNAFPPLLKRLRNYVVPVYDYALMSEPMSPEQHDAIGWRGRQGVSDSGNQFHYYRITADNRILWGGYDAEYHWDNGFGPQYHNNPEAEARLATHFLETFPQLEGIRFTHAWGGAIDTCSRFSAFWGTAYDGRVAYATGYTGLGVGATRFGAAVVLDLLDGRDTERTRLEMVRRKPLPFPPEPLRSVGIGITRWSLDRADRDGGRRNLWLRTLDAVGLGFDS